MTLLPSFNIIQHNRHGSINCSVYVFFLVLVSLCFSVYFTASVSLQSILVSLLMEESQHQVITINRFCL